jgi:general stress protein 26
MFVVPSCASPIIRTAWDGRETERAHARREEAETMDVVRRILESLQAEPAFLCALATVMEDGRPSVRTMRATIDDALIIRCPTFLGTSKVAEIRARPDVHVACGSTDSDRPGSYFRIEGRAAISTDPDDRRLAWNDRLAKWFDGPEDPSYGVVRISPIRIVTHPIGGGPEAQVWEA